jgi:hypothetical protein
MLNVSTMKVSVFFASLGKLACMALSPCMWPDNSRAVTGLVQRYAILRSSGIVAAVFRHRCTCIEISAGFDAATGQVKR